MQDRLPSGSQAEFGALLSSTQHRVALRAVVVTLHMAGSTARTASVFTETHVRTVQRWVFRMQGGRPLTDMPRCGRPRLFSESTRLMTIAVYCQKCPPLPGVYRWSLRDAHRYFKEHPECVGASISRATIQRILAEHVLKPHRSKYYLQITDPDFFPKMEHIIGCYLHPPQNLYCYDECTCIQALERLTPNLPATENQPVLEDFDYSRNGITDLLAFLNPATGKVDARCTSNHDRHVFCRFFKDHVRAHPPDAVLHYIMDNLSTHYHDDFCHTVAELCAVPYSPLKSGAERRQWLQSEHKRIVVHFVPFHASWLNMVEIWFGILKSKCLKHNHFRSVEQLREAIRAFVETWNEFFAHPFTWSYTGDGLHAKAVRRFCTLLAIQTDQMDCKFLTSQLLLMSNIADSYLDLIPSGDWLKLINLAVERDSYITNIIDTDTKPRRRKKAREAYNQFNQSVISQTQPLAETA
jgi:transposase